jgi:tellurite resistance protein
MSNGSSRPAVFFHPSRTTVDAMAKACAMMACADGHVSKSERLAFMRFLRHHGILERQGRRPAIAVFETAMRNTSLLTLGEICTAADDLRAAAGQYGAAYVAQAAAHVALADGVTWPQEIALLEVIRDRVGLGYPPSWSSH